ncbi:MAG: class I SAM-dependent methyltransferase [Acidobacteria bacterium]|nr:MAG: class I SAM-dependent methyltransferase [Acidobacteriota bacterium]
MDQKSHVDDFKCSLCGSSGLKQAFRKGVHEFYACPACRHVRVFPYPTDEETEAHHARGFTPDYLSQNEAWFKVLAATRLGILKNELEEGFVGSLLDAGSGFGFFLKEAKLAGWRVLGIESSPSEFDYSTQELCIDVLKENLEEGLVSLPSASFEVVTFWHVLEHLEQPGLVLREATRVLKKGGILALNSPNLDSAAFRLLGGRWSWVYVPGHLQYFRAKPFARWLETQGLTVDRLETWTHAPNLYFMLEEAFLLTAARLMERIPVIRKPSSGIKRFVYGSYHQQVVQARLRALYNLTPYLDRYLRSRFLGHEFLLLATKSRD